MRAKLIIIFVIIKVIPLVLLALLAWRQAWLLGEELSQRTQELTVRANEALSKTGDIAVKDSVKALNERATDDIERMTTDTARRVADFLYERDDDLIAQNTQALGKFKERIKAFEAQRREIDQAIEVLHDASARLEASLAERAGRAAFG